MQKTVNKVSFKEFAQPVLQKSKKETVFKRLMILSQMHMLAKKREDVYLLRKSSPSSEHAPLRQIGTTVAS